MTVIQVDGGNPVDATPAAETVGILYPGERMDVIIERLSSGEVKDPILTISLDREQVTLIVSSFELTIVGI